MSSRKIDRDSSLPVVSMLRLYNALEDSNYNKYNNIFRSYIISADIGDIFTYYTVQHNDWFDLIAHKYYNNSRLWWLVAIANDIKNPFESLDEGDIIRIIKSQYLFKIFDNMSEIEGL